MSYRADVIKALSGALLLARFNKDGLSAFGHHREDAAKSFIATVIVVPMFLIWIATHGFDAGPDVPLPFALFYDILSYACGWMLFPVLMWHVSLILGCRERFFHFIAAYNWSAVIQNGIFLAADIIFNFSGAPEGARAFFGMVLLVYVLLYGWFIAHSALGLSAGPASMVVALDILTSLIWESFTAQLVMSN